jgi:hypothetical protein
MEGTFQSFREVLGSAQWIREFDRARFVRSAGSDPSPAELNTMLGMGRGRTHVNEIQRHGVRESVRHLYLGSVYEVTLD